MRRLFWWVASLVAVVLMVATSPLAAQKGKKSGGGGGVTPFCAGGCITYGVIVTPDNQPRTAPIDSGEFTFPFEVQDTGNQTETFTVSCSILGHIVCDSLTSGELLMAQKSGGSASPFCLSCGGGSISVTPGAGSSAEVVAWVHSTDPAGSATLTVTATGTHSDVDHGSYSITLYQKAAPVAALINNNPNELARDLCFTSGAGEQAGLACGDLFVTHGMPAYRTLGRDRSLTLEYNSATAAGLLLVPVAVTEGSSTETPNSVKIVLKVGTAKDSASFTPPSGATTQQMVLGRGLGALATGVYAETLTVTNQYSSSSNTATVTGQVLVVNRSSSQYGKGWGLDGVEQLIPGQTGGNLLWVDGDGSARLYAKINSTTWVAPAAGFRDTISLAGGLYTRSLRHGVQVVFDTLGRHVRTYNRLGDTTTFAYTTVAGQNRLSTITVPPNDAKTRRYHFYYNSSTAALDSIRDPGGRRLKSVMTSGQLTSLTDPDGQVTSYEYSGTTSMMTRQVFARPAVSGGTAGTVYVYANNSRVTQVKIPAGGTGTDTVRLAMTPWDERGLASSAGATGQTGYDVTSTVASTLVDGPIPGVGDQVQVWVNQFGAPTKTILTGNGATTTMVYGDTAHPALATQVTSPTSVVSKMHYNARGNLDTLWRSSPDSSSGLPNRRQTWAYADASTPDGPTTVKDPLGRTTTYAYTSLGLTDSVVDSRGHHTDYGYVSSGSLKGMLDSVVDWNVPTWWQSDSALHPDTTHLQNLRTLFTYDTNGNVLTTLAPNGAYTTTQADTLGRVIKVWNAYNHYSQYTYDAMNRATVYLRGLTYWPTNPFVPNDTASCDHNQFICHDNTTIWGTLGLPDSVFTHYYYTDGMLDSLTDPRDVVRGYRYDARNNRWKDVDDYGNAAITYSGSRGLVDSTKSRSGVVVHFGYDSLGRRIWMAYPSRTFAARDIFPAHTVLGDSVTYTYDTFGRMLDQNSIARSYGRDDYTYYADGSLKSQTVTAPNSDTLTYRYDSTGTRTYLYHTTISGLIASKDSTHYYFNGTSGDLDSLSVWWLTPSFGLRTVRFQWDALGRRSKVTYPNGTTVVTLLYDAGGTLRRLRSTGSSSLHLELTNQQSDLMGRVQASYLVCDGPMTAGAYACGSSTALTTSNVYNTLDAVGIQNNAWHHDTLQYDASGNIIYRASTENGSNTYLYPAKHNRDSTISHPNGAGTVVTTITYTADGDRLSEDVQGPVGVNHDDSRYYYYDGLGRMKGLSNYIWDAGSGGFVGDDQWDRCIYGPEGKIVYSCGDGGAVSYDGDNVVATSSSVWHFIQGPGTDDPLLGAAMAPSGGGTMELYYITDGQGRQYAVADPTGYFNPDLALGTGVSGWKGWPQAGGIQNAQSFSANRNGNTSTPQLSFFRNRIYDQRSGQWTQEDPAGVAGGVNLYQYVGNDPVSFTDPFGLCKESGPKCPSMLQQAWNAFSTAVNKFFGKGSQEVANAVSKGAESSVANVVANTDISARVTAGPVQATFGLTSSGGSISVSPSVELSAMVDATYTAPGTHSGVPLSIGGDAGEGLMVGGSLNTVGGKLVGATVSAGVGVGVDLKLGSAAKRLGHLSATVVQW